MNKKPPSWDTSHRPLYRSYQRRDRSRSRQLITPTIFGSLPCTSCHNSSNVKKLHTLDEKVINKRVILITAPIPHMIKIPSTSNMDSFQCRQTLRVVQRLEFNRRQSFTLETNQLENNMNMCCISLNKFLSQFSDFKFSKPINCIPTKTTNK